MQGLKRRKAGGHGSHQARSTSFKIEPTPQIDLTGQETLGKADPEENRLQPAQDTAEDISSSKPAAGSRRNPSRFVAAAGIAKRIRSEAEDALVKDPCRLAAETGTAKRSKSDAEDAPVPLYACQLLLQAQPSASRTKQSTPQSSTQPSGPGPNKRHRLLS